MQPAFKGRRTVAEAMAETHTSSPSAALHVLKKQNKRMVYLPHCGSKQRTKLRQRILAQLTSIGERRGFTGLQQAQKPEIAGFIKANPELFESALSMDAALIIDEPQRILDRFAEQAHKVSQSQVNT